MSRFEQPDDNGLSFYAPLLNSLVLARGTGSPTFTRATAATQTDHEGKLNQVLSGEARFQGARRVQNLVVANSGMEAWTTTPTRPTNWSLGANITTVQVTGWDGTGSAAQLSGTVSGNVGTNRLTTVTPITLNHVYRVSCRARRISGSSDLFVAFDSTGTYNVTNGVVDTTWRRYSCPAFTCLANLGNFGFYANTSGEVFEIDDVQLEDVTGQVIQNPGSYVSVGVLSAPYHGANVDGVKYFDTTNANTVTANVVTEQRGTDIPYSTLLGYLAEEARTNLVLQSDDFTQVAQWPVTNVTVGGSILVPDGSTRTTNKLLLTATATVTHNILQSFTKAASALPYAFTIYAKAAEYGFLAIRVDDGGANGAHCSFNLSTGAVGTAATGDGVAFTALSSKITAVGSGWYRCEFDFTSNTGTVLRVVPTVQDIDGNPFSYTFTATLNSGLYLWRAQLEQAAFATSSIPTTTVAVQRNSDVLSYPTAGNMNNSFGGCYAEITYSTYSSGPDVLSTYTGLTGILMNLLASQLGMYDGTSRAIPVSTIPATAPVTTPINVGTVWGGVLCNGYCAGTKGTAQVFGGTMNFGPTIWIMNRQGTANFPCGTIRFAKIWSRQLQDIDEIQCTR